MIKRILFLFLVLITAKATAQRTNSSPYSFFGIGEEFNTKTVEQMSMGGIGAAYSSSYYLNFTNPAANADLRYATYSLGALNNDLSVKYADGKQSSTSTSLSYIGFGVPLGKKAGFSVGLQPVSSVGYSLTNQVLNTDSEISEITLFSGNGGVNRIYGSFGIKLTKNLSVGIEGSFAFGNVENTILKRLQDVQFATKYSQISRVRGGLVKIGVQYKKELKNKLRIDIGAVLKLENTLKLTGTELLYSLSVSSSGVENPRDITIDRSISGNFKSPLQSTIGFGFGKVSKWYTAFEYEYQNALDANGYLEESNNAYSYGNSNRVSIGGFYIPKINSISSYWQRVTYRTGIRFEKTGLLVNGTSISNNFTAINDYGMSFGLGLPLGKKLSNVNLGFEYGKRGTTNNNLIEENYFNFRLSLSLNDVNWFIQRQID